MSESRSSGGTFSTTVELPGSAPQALPDISRSSSLASMQTVTPTTKPADSWDNPALAFSQVVKEGPNREVIPADPKPTPLPPRKRLKRVFEPREPKFPNRTVMCPICTYLVPVPEAGYHVKKDSKVR